MEHKGTVEMTTERLLLRPFCMEDAAAMYRNWASDDQVTRYLTWPSHANAEVSRQILSVWTKEYSDPRYYQWCIARLPDQEAIGSIAAVHLEEAVDAVEIGYCIAKPFWNKGMMTEALTRLIAFFFEEVRCNRICAKHDPHNPGSGRVMEKAGMRYEGTLRQSGRNNLGICDLAIYAITADEYFSRSRGDATDSCTIPTAKGGS